MKIVKLPVEYRRYLIEEKNTWYMVTMNIGCS